MLWGFKHREIAEQLGLPLGTVTSKYKDAIAKLKKISQGGDGMNRFFLKRKLNRELGRVVERMPSEFAPEEPSARRRPRLRWAALAASCAALAVLIPLAVWAGRPAVVKTGSIILMEMNPSVRILTDESDCVTGVYSMNADGDVLLADSAFTLSLGGRPAAEAAVAVADRAFSMGYLGEDQPMRLTVAGDSPAFAEETGRELEEALVAHFCSKGVFAPVLAGTEELSAFGAGKTAGETVKSALRPAVTLAEDAARNTPASEIESEYRFSFLRYTRAITDYIYDVSSAKRRRMAEIEVAADAVAAHPDNPGQALPDPHRAFVLDGEGAVRSGGFLACFSAAHGAGGHADTAV